MPGGVAVIRGLKPGAGSNHIGVWCGAVRSPGFCAAPGCQEAACEWTMESLVPRPPFLIETRTWSEVPLEMETRACSK